jgi:5'-nucleotidase (lipoprotein e(P4) family)
MEGLSAGLALEDRPLIVRVLLCRTWMRLGALALSGAVAAGCAQELPAPPEAPTGNSLITAVAWKRASAEYEALYHQGFNVARMHVERRLEELRAQKTDPDVLPVAVIVDLDDTVLDTRDYWRELIEAGIDFFDDARWDAWVAKNRGRPSPGAYEFLTFCQSQKVHVFYITSRDQGETTMALALKQLQGGGLPYADEEHVTVIKDSDKEPRQVAIKQKYDVVVLLGDNLNDFRRYYYVTERDERLRRMNEDAEQFGRKFILFPNPTDGHWVRAIFGTSEPAATPENRELLRNVAAGR